MLVCVRSALLALALLWTAAVQAQLGLRIPDPSQMEPPAVAGYYPAALRLALEKTATAKPVAPFVVADQPGMSRERYRLMLTEGEIDVLWSSTTPEREALYEPVRFNLLKGVNEYRVLLVRRSDLARFESVRSLADLQALTAGAGLHWSDAKVLRTNGLRVVTAANHESLFRMLAGRRFDFMARSLAEAQGDVLAYPELDLALEPRLLLQYQQPIYFFVGKGNRALAERIRRGLALAEADGSLDRLFFSTPALRDAWASIHGERAADAAAGKKPSAAAPPLTAKRLTLKLAPL